MVKIEFELTVCCVEQTSLIMSSAYFIILLKWNRARFGGKKDGRRAGRGVSFLGSKRQEATGSSEARSSPWNISRLRLASYSLFYTELNCALTMRLLWSIVMVVLDLHLILYPTAAPIRLDVSQYAYVSDMAAHYRRGNEPIRKSFSSSLPYNTGRFYY